jgi:hypothetical protein
VKLRTGLVLAPILVLGATGYFLVRSAEDRVNANMLSGVERFAIPLNWQVEDENCPAVTATPLEQAISETRLSYRSPVGPTG